MIKVFSKKQDGCIVYVRNIADEGGRDKKKRCEVAATVADHTPLTPSQGFSWKNWKPSRKTYEVERGLWGFVHDDAQRGARSSGSPARSWKHQSRHFLWCRREKRQFKERLREMLMAGDSVLNSADTPHDLNAHLDACKEFMLLDDDGEDMFDACEGLAFA